MGLLLLSRARMRDTLLWLRSAIDYGVQEQQQPDDATASSDASSATTVDPAEWSRVLREAGSAGRHAMRPCRKILWIAKGEETGGEDSSDGESLGILLQLALKLQPRLELPASMCQDGQGHQAGRDIAQHMSVLRSFWALFQ
ncbi:hypothetical protein CFC21_065265 [Triticum aestivum]|uniref:Uncharacterized protein n=3 Tax=Triticum TaxID=4564 RepID=A0A9R0WLH7_TRITD|nr:hypothetical protein CFC21_065265 [Triticum aestivum]VAI16084.1 unnamed protein product [Triticum turgidum subsp. durum]